ncbi:short chain-specific acyl CoA dehydrogenase [Legionella birminghamensis]|uniref:Acyl-CoA dehydrogenase n=1 Tax=Legionella birminghamensis TaxID=28083 RepID=A0A378IAX9_9GAMM|nr:acyl-CoA dehydrogenase family protein [Legionella birminghamensis]KTC67773.1 short chain-specific acyl CoA dehydrogenase [Legionella birminghamensis]STX32036.1 Acyl-CoA dehydrogenase [Legionella birminghamensis]
MDSQSVYNKARDALKQWNEQLKSRILRSNSCLMHSYSILFADDLQFIEQLKQFANRVAAELEPVVAENNLNENLPELSQFNSIGERHDRVIHHPSYVQAGDIIYSTGLMEFLRHPGQMKKTLALFILSSHAGEAGHNCPIACSAGIIRILTKSPLKNNDFYMEKLLAPSFTHNFTGAQFLTEIQGGSDVGANATIAFQDEKKSWRIVGEKWFCSNANADLILLTARTNPQASGTKGLSLFMVPAKLDDDTDNRYKLRRLKQKIGTRSMATAEIDFEGALAYLIGNANDGIHLVMENVLHLSRLFNAFSVLGMTRRAYQIAYYYACNREAFGRKIIAYPLVKEHLARIKADLMAMLASSFHMVDLQDSFDSKSENAIDEKQKYLLRTLANLNKYFTAKHAVEHIHHCLDVLAGNGTIESFSSLPRLLRDCIVCENWEGTHFTLWMQILRDILRFEVDEIFLDHLRSLLEKIKKTRYKELFNKQIISLKTHFIFLKSLSNEQQTLHIKEIVEKMAALMAAISLAIEVQQGKPPIAKKACLDLFIQSYFLEKENGEQYLKLLETIFAQE